MKKAIYVIPLRLSSFFILISSPGGRGRLEPVRGTVKNNSIDVDSKREKIAEETLKG